ncbi:putative methyltransferase [Amphibalanus amphitrite]|uniref:Putative methyltransferase n=1 Tax=Amphibalanus amphitrite TaxID=1232801 RepID=A0A6A4VIS1_AMPAM|nr:putative methyltransferase DDB_G0268948 [Amphibalanus amphitrite]KAF0291434.1 putative methyltransferase [Amphibalanus amphitrite]
MAARFFEGTNHAELYVRYRPATPSTLVQLVCDYIKEKVPGPLRQAVDVGCGSGQGTQLLAPHFERVLGTDVSPAQVAKAEAAPGAVNIAYSVSPAEAIALPSHSCDLVMAVQACHWFDMSTFLPESARVLRPGGALALVGYRLPAPVWQGREREDVRELLAESYVSGLAGWIQQGSVDTYINGYSDSRFTSPLEDHRRDESTFCDLDGTVADMVGYCSTWSGFQNMVADKGQEAGQKFLDDIQNRVLALLGDGATPESSIVIRFRYFVLLSRKPVDTK